MSFLSEVMADAPVGYWRLGESSGTTAADASGNSRNGTYVGAPTLGAASLLAADPGNTAVVLNGSTQRVTVPPSGGAFGAAAFTIEAWIKTSTTSKYSAILDRDDGATQRAWQFRVEQTTGKLQFLRVMNAAGTIAVVGVTSSAVVADGMVHQVAATYDGSTIRVYVDGTESGSAAAAGGILAAPGYGLTIGRSGSSATNGETDFNGTVDEVAYFGTALSAARIAAHYSAGSTPGSTPTTISGAQASEADTSLAGSAAVGAVAAGGKATEADTAQMGTAASGGIVPGGQATETDAVSSGTVSAPAAPVTTDTSNAAHARTRGGWGVATWEPAVVPRPLVYGAQSLYAVAYGEPIMAGTMPTYTMSQEWKPKWRQRVLIGGKDWTYERGVETPDVEYQLADPLLYGPATVRLPQVSATREWGRPWLASLRKSRRVKVQLVDDNNVVQATVYKGFVMDPNVDGANLTLAVGGEAQGRAALRDKQVPVFRDVLDLKRILWRALTDLGIRFIPRLGEPGIGIRSLTFGGTGMLEHIEEALSRATKRDGTMRTVMPNTDGDYELVDKDTTTVHWTVFLDETVTIGNLNSDMAEHPNRVYATTIAPSGMRVNFAAVPGLVQGPAPDYPMAGGANFGIGTTNEDTVDGDGISVMVNRLGAVNLLDIRDTPGGFDEDVADALARLQVKAKLTGPVGVMTTALWAALWDLEVTGFDRKWSSIQPAAQDPSVERYKRSGSGAVIGLNDEYDEDVIPVDLTVDMGSGFTGQQAARFADSLVCDPDTDDWYGTIILRGGAVLTGQVAVGATVTANMMTDARLVKPCENLWVPNFNGGTLFHIAAIDVKASEIRFVVDTRARPARQVWERIKVRKETRRNPARRWLGNRQSTSQKDAVQGFLSFGGKVDRNVPLQAGWNTLEVVVGDYGTIAQIQTVVQTISGTGGTVAVDPSEYALAVFGKPVTAARLNALVPAPLAENGDRAWRRSATRKALAERWLLYSAGTFEEPCGYGADEKTDEAPLTGEHFDDGGFPYKAEDGCVVTLALWVPAATTLRRGRIMWPLLEGGV